MLKINLLPVREARRAADLRQLGMQLLLVMIVAGGGIAMVNSRMSEKIELAEVRVGQMRHDIEQFKPQLEQVAAYRKRKAKLEKKIDVIDGLDRARNGPVRVLTELTQRTPERLWITKLTTKGSELALQGRSLDNEVVALFLRGLSESEHFSGVDLDSTEMTTTNTGLKVVNFKIRAAIVTSKAAEAAKPSKAGKKKSATS